MAKRKARTRRPRTLCLRGAEPRAGRAPQRVEAPRSTVQKLIPVLLIAVGLAAYQNSLDGPFFFDDYTVIRDNPHIGELWPPWAWQPRGESTVSWRPIASLSLAINYALGGTRVQGYHVFNVTAVLSPASSCSASCVGPSRASGSGTAMGARLRGWRWRSRSSGSSIPCRRRPSTTSSSDQLDGLFFLLTLYCVIRADTSPHRGIWSVAAIGACASAWAARK